MAWKTQVSLIVSVIVYVVFGSVFFHLLEKSNEKEIHDDYWRFRQELLTGNQSCLTPELLDKIVKNVVKAHTEGALSMEDENDEGERWAFTSALFFSVTVVTTIGYGNLAPSTTGGQVFCIFYALVGIPLVLAALAGISEKLIVLESKLSVFLKRLEKYSKLHAVARILLVFLIGLVIFVFLPSIVFSFTEDWTFGEGMYFSIITLTTIGFGDYIPAIETTASHRYVKRVLLAIWIFIGLAWVSLLFAMIQIRMLAISKKIDESDQEPENVDLTTRTKQQSTSFNRRAEHSITPAC